MLTHHNKATAPQHRPLAKTIDTELYVVNVVGGLQSKKNITLPWVKPRTCSEHIVCYVYNLTSHKHTNREASTVRRILTLPLAELFGFDIPYSHTCTELNKLGFW